MKITRFEDIEAWQEARKLVKLIYDAINANKNFSKDFRLANQLQGAAVSTMSKAQILFNRVKRGFRARATKSLSNTYLYPKVLLRKSRAIFM